MKQISISQVSCLTKSIPPTKDALVLLHGYGASQQDLAPIGDYLPATQAKSQYYPDGIISVPLGMHMTGRAWFPIDMEELEAAMREGRSRALYSKSLPAGFLEAKDKLVALLSEIQKDHDRIILGGFSQGSMMALELALNSEVAIHKLALLSSTLVAKDRLIKALELKAPPFPIFQSHGLSDMVLPISSARELKETLLEHGSQVDYHEFQGGHEIPPEVLKKLNLFLEKE